MSHELALHLEHLFLFLALAGLLALSIIRNGPVRRALRRRALCEAAVRYAEQLGGTGAQKKLHALGYAQIIDMSDNGKRDYSDAELGVEIESVLGGL